MNTARPVDLGRAIEASSSDPLLRISRTGSPIPGDPPVLMSRSGSPFLAPTPRPDPLHISQITKDSFDGARYAMKSAVFQQIRPYLETLVSKAPSGKKEEKKKEEKATEEEKFTRVDRITRITDDTFNAVVTYVKDSISTTANAEIKRKKINKAAVDLWNANSGKVDDLPGLKKSLIDAANAT